MKALYFPGRTWEEVRAAAARILPAMEYGRFLAFLEQGIRDVKREDAILALRTVPGEKVPC